MGRFAPLLVVAGALAAVMGFFTRPAIVVRIGRPGHGR